MCYQYELHVKIILVDIASPYIEQYQYEYH